MSREQELDRYLTTPPDDDRKVVHECSDCGAEIYEGDYYYEIEGNNYCENCVVDLFRKEAELPDYESEDY